MSPLRGLTIFTDNNFYHNFVSTRLNPAYCLFQKGSFSNRPSTERKLYERLSYINHLYIRLWENQSGSLQIPNRFGF